VRAIQIQDDLGLVDSSTKMSVQIWIR